MVAPGSRSPEFEPQRLLRRINPEWIVPDYENDEWRTSSQAYQPHPVSKKLSVTCVEAFRSEEEAVEAVLDDLDGYGVVEIARSDLDVAELTLEPDPLPTNRGHMMITGTKKKSKQRALARAAAWVVNPRSGQPLPPLD